MMLESKGILRGHFCHQAAGRLTEETTRRVIAHNHEVQPETSTDTHFRRGDRQSAFRNVMTGADEAVLDGGIQGLVDPGRDHGNSWNKIDDGR